MRKECTRRNGNKPYLDRCTQHKGKEKKKAEQQQAQKIGQKLGAKKSKLRFGGPTPCRSRQMTGASRAPPLMGYTKSMSYNKAVNLLQLFEQIHIL